MDFMIFQWLKQKMPFETLNSNSKHYLCINIAHSKDSINIILHLYLLRILEEHLTYPH